MVLRLLLAATLVLALFGVVSCSGSESQSSPASTASNTAPTSTTTTRAPATSTVTTTSLPTTTSVPVTTSSPTEPPTFVKIDDVLYNGSEAVDIYSPLEAEMAPVIVVLHGAAANPGRYAPLAEALASQGVVVMNVEWPSERASQQSAEAVACAVRYARANATEFGGDPSNVTVVGHSAGAAIGSVIALTGDSWTGDCPVDSVSGQPDSFVGLAGPYDPTVTPGDDRSFIRQTNPQLYERLNPFNHLGGNPGLVVFLVHGDSDNLVPTESSTQFDAALRDAGYAVTLAIVEGAGHETLVSFTSDAFAGTVDLILEAALR